MTYMEAFERWFRAQDIQFQHRNSREDTLIAWQAAISYEREAVFVSKPKQKTVMVKLLVEDAEIISRLAGVENRASTACRKALEEMK